MADQPVAPAAPESPKSFEQSWEAARAELLPESEKSQVDEAVVQPPDESGESGQAETEQAAPPEPEPDHIRWVKSVSGHFDAKTNQINIDRVAKQAYELQKALGQRDNQINQINTLLQRPEILEAIDRMQKGGKQETQQQKQEEPQSEEAVLADFVKKTVDAEYKPVVTKMEQTIQVLTQNFTRAKVNEARSELRSDLGNDESGSPLIDGVWDEVANTISQTAVRAGLNPDKVIEMMAANDTLKQTVADVAKQILFPRFREAVAAKKAEPAKVPTETKRKLAASPRPTSNARPAEFDINSFDDAVTAAKRELKIAE